MMTSWVLRVASSAGLCPGTRESGGLAHEEHLSLGVLYEGKDSSGSIFETSKLRGLSIGSDWRTEEAGPCWC